jgi:hypothetical protein
VGSDQRSSGIDDPLARLGLARERSREESPGNPYHRARLVAIAAAEYYDEVALWLRARGHDQTASAVERRAAAARKRAAEDAALE